MDTSKLPELFELLDKIRPLEANQHWFGLPETVQNWLVRSKQPKRLVTVRALYQLLVSEFDPEYVIWRTCGTEGCQNPYHHRVLKRTTPGLAKVRKRRLQSEQI